MPKKLDGFPNEFLYVLPSAVLKDFTFSPVVQKLHITDLGFYPHAQYHYVYREHGAPQWILIFCSSGKGTVKIGSNTWRIKRGSLVILPPDVEHTYYADDSQPWDIFWAHFTGKDVQYYLPSSSNDLRQGLFKQIATDKTISFLMDSFWNMLKAFDQGFSYQAVFFVSQLLGAVLAYLGLHNDTSGNDTSPANELVNHTMQYIYDHLDQSVQLEDLHTLLGVSTSYLSRLFKTTVGISINRFITEAKMQQASHYLQNTQLPIQQIAHQLGYNDAYYFSRVFKKTFRVSPLHYRHHYQ